jgi:hypothetical protein
MGGESRLFFHKKTKNVTETAHFLIKIKKLLVKSIV